MQFETLTTTVTPLLDPVQPSMTEAISLSKNLHHLKTSAKSDGAIDLKLVQAHMKSIERKFKVRDNVLRGHI